jgi:DNA-directed RNA polymerase specialized sigma subunit
MLPTPASTAASRIAPTGVVRNVVDPHHDLLPRVDDRLSVAPLRVDVPDREQRILLLRCFHDCTQTEIAELTGISQMHVSPLLSRTLGQLRRRWPTRL